MIGVIQPGPVGNDQGLAVFLQWLLQMCIWNVIMRNDELYSVDNP